MNRQNRDQKQRQIARLGLLALAVGIGYAGMRVRSAKPRRGTGRRI